MLLWSSLLLLVAALALAACSSNDDSAAAALVVPADSDADQSISNSSAQDEPTATEGETGEKAEAVGEPGSPTDSGYPITLQDNAGAQLVLEARPQRVIAVLPSAVDLIIDLGLVNRLVGVDDFSLHRAPDAASIGGNSFVFNIEAIAQLQPDFMLLAIGGTEELAQQARDLGIPVYAIGFPASLEEVFEQLRLVGAILSEADAADALTSDLEARFDAVAENVAGAEPLRVYLEVDQSTPTQPFSVGPGSLHQQIIELAGGVNIFAGAEGPFPQVNWEGIIAGDPEVILLLDSKEFGGELAFNPISAGEVGRRTGWDGIAAVRNGLVVPLPNDLFSVGAGLVDALEQVADALDAARAVLTDAA